MTFAEKIKTLREERKITKKQLYEALKINARDYNKIENGTQTATNKQVSVIAKVLQVNSDELLVLLSNNQNLSQNLNNNKTNFSETKGVLTREEIKPLISDSFKESSLQNASYDLCLGDEYYVPSKQKQEYCRETQKEILSCPFHKEEIYGDVQKCSTENGVLKISPFSTIVFSTEEKLKMPDNVIGRFDLRVRFAMQGLVLQVGTQIEPGYEGRLFGLLLNFSDKEICIPQGMRLLTAEFSYTTSSVKIEEDNNKKYDSLDKFIKRFTPTQGTLEAFFKRINDIYGKNQEIHEKVENEIMKVEALKNKRNNNIITWVLAAVGIIYSISIPFMVTHITKATIDKDDYPFKTIIQVEEENKILKNKKDSLELKILELDSQLNSKNDSLRQEMSDIKKQIERIDKNK